jgi:hypothetical protein
MTIARVFAPVLAIAVLAGTARLSAQVQEKPVAAPADQEALFKKFEESMSGVKLVGKYTVTGKEEDKRSTEEYTITSVKKIPKGDYWLINARIKYGGNDVTLPLPMEIKWAGDTPVISITDFTIPGLGTFTARVLFYDGKYVGTWQHGEAGGHMLGEIVKLDADTEKPQEKPAEK